MKVPVASDEVDDQLGPEAGSKSEAGSQLVGVNGSFKSADAADDVDMAGTVTATGIDDETSPYDCVGVGNPRWVRKSTPE
jgi:hypothetical protein